MTPKQLYELADNVFGKRSSLLLLWQEIAEHFYSERADFTSKRSLGTDFASGQMTSFPALCRRELADQCGTMLRPTAKEWFHLGVLDQAREDNESKRWLQWAGSTMRLAMYDRKALFTKAQKEADNDFSCFGQAVTSVRLNRARDRLLYRCWHLRDCAWIENEDGAIGAVFRKWKPTAQTLKRLWGDKIHNNVQQFIDRNQPFEEIDCIHMMVEADMYDEAPGRRPYWSIYYDCQHQHLLEAVPSWNMEYNVSRWETVSGSQYAYSPATVAALPDARLLQAMTYTLLEAGEKVTNPPMIASIDAVRSDLAIYAGGAIWVDRDYDERMGEALRPMNIDAKGMPLGIDMLKDSRALLAQCFYLNKLKPFSPTTDPQMTAFQAGQIVAQYIRDALPLFEPMEMERNGGECELTFDVLMRNGGFGSPMDMPKSLQAGADIQFRFESPLHDAIGAQKGQKFLEMKQLIVEAVALDASAGAIPDVLEALRDAMDGTGVPAKWVRDPVTVKQITDQQKAAADAAQAIEAMQGASEAAKNLGSAMKDRAAATGVPGTAMQPA